MRLIVVTLVTLRELALPLLLGVLCVWWVRRRRRRKQAAWEGYIRDECALYLEEVLLAGH